MATAATLDGFDNLATNFGVSRAPRAVRARLVMLERILEGDLLDLLHGNGADFVPVRFTRAFFQLGGLQKQHRRRGRLGDEGKRAIMVHGDHHRNNHALLVGRSGVERLAEFHNVQAVLTQRRTHGGRGVGDTAGNLQLDLGNFFFSHNDLPFCAGTGKAGGRRMPQPLDT